MKITKPLKLINGYLCVRLTSEDLKALGKNLKKGDMVIIENPFETQ
jgi:hypothetical protein